MSQDYFPNAPTVGSHDHQVSVEELQARIRDLERRLNEAQEPFAAEEEEKSGKIRWKTFLEFFDTVVKPILIFIPRLLTALAALLTVLVASKGISASFA